MKGEFLKHNNMKIKLSILLIIFTILGFLKLFAIENPNETALFFLKETNIITNNSMFVNTDSTTSYHLQLLSTAFGTNNNTELSLLDFGKKYWDVNDKHIFFNHIPQKINLGYVMNFTPIRFLWHKNNFTNSFSISEKVEGNIHIPESMLELLLYGNTPEKKFLFNDLSSKMLWYRSYSFATKIRIDDITLGLGVNYLQGFGYYNFDFTNSSLYTDKDYNIITMLWASGQSAFADNYYQTFNSGNDFNYNLFPKNGGSGFSYDISLAYQLSKSQRFNIALQDWGNIIWKHNNETHELVKLISISDISESQYLDSIISNVRFDTKSTTELSTPLSTKLSFNYSYEIFNNLSLIATQNAFLFEPIAKDLAISSSLAFISTPISFLPTISSAISLNYYGNVVIPFALLYETNYFDIYIGTNDLPQLFSDEIKGSFIFSINIHTPTRSIPIENSVDINEDTNDDLPEYNPDEYEEDEDIEK